MAGLALDIGTCMFTGVPFIRRRFMAGAAEIGVRRERHQALWVT